MRKWLRQNSLNFISIFIILGSILLSVHVFSLTESEYEAQQAEIEAKSNNIQSELDKFNAGLDDAINKKGTLQEEVAQVQSEITEIEKLVQDSNILINKLDVQIEETRNRIEDVRSEMRIVLRQIQKNQKVSPIQSVLNSENLGQAIGRIYTLSTVNADAQDLRDELENKTNELELNLAKQEQSKADLENSKVLLTSKKSYAEALINDYQGKEDEYAKQVAELKSQQRISQEEAQNLQAEWEAEQKRLRELSTRQPPSNTGGGTGGNGGGSGGGGNSLPPSGSPVGCWFEDTSDPGVPAGFFQSPTNGGRVTDNFGCPSWSGRFHDAYDIAAPHNSPLLATAAGIVETKGYQGGYGYFIMLKHTLPNGRRVYSLYAHLSGPSPLANGASISKGQVVGNMGCTGWCSGTHVHFMLYSESYESSGLGCRHGASKCYNTSRFVPI